MGIIDRIRELFGGRQSGAEYGVATAGGAAATTTGDDSPYDQSQSDSGWSGDAGSSGDGGGGGGGGGGNGV